MTARSPAPCRYALCLHNFLLLVRLGCAVSCCTAPQLAGCLTSGLGVWTLLRRWDVLSVVPGPAYTLTVWLLLATGVAAVLAALTGYIAIALESRALLAWVSGIVNTSLQCLVWCSDVSI